MTTPEDRIAMLSKRDDLPEEVKRQLGKVPPREWLRVQIVEVLRSGQEMHIDEILAQVWRLFKKIANKRSVNNRLIELCQSGEVKRIRHGFYKITEELK